MNKSLTYTVLITHGPHHQRAMTALEFCRALLKKHHLIQKIFFYSEGIYLGTATHYAAEDEIDILTHWQQFILENNINAKLCVSAALKRGIIDEGYAKHYHHHFVTAAKGFKLVGLGELYEGMLECERFISF